VRDMITIAAGIGSAPIVLRQLEVRQPFEVRRQRFPRSLDHLDTSCYDLA
jgi:hypothetical protein